MWDILIKSISTELTSNVSRRAFTVSAYAVVCDGLVVPYTGDYNSWRNHGNLEQSIKERCQHHFR